MELLNTTRLAVAWTLVMAPDGQESLVVVAKGTFELPLDGGEARLAERQRPLLIADAYDGEPGLSAPCREMDFAPPKPFCDVLVSGSAHAPGGRPATRIEAGIRVGRVCKTLTVVGPRQWQPGGRHGTGAGRAQPFVEQAISYAEAFGGSHPVAGEPARRHCYPDNPVGRGWFPREMATAEIVGLALPATEEPGRPVERPDGDYRPMALGPVGRGWPPRAAFAGTYDERWQAEVFPFLPADFDPRYFQAAPTDQQTEHLKGGEEVLLLNLTARERAGFRVPTLEVPVTFFAKKGGHDTVRAVIDTLAVDTDAGCVEIVWRTSRPLRRNLFEIAQVLVGRLSGAWWRARQQGKDYYPSLAALAKSRQAAEERD